MSLRHSTARLLTTPTTRALGNPTTGSLTTVTLGHPQRRYARNKPFSNLSDEELSAEYAKFRRWAEETFSNATEPTYLGQFDLKKLQRKEGPRAEQDAMKIFPQNRYFKAQPVLSEEFKNEIYRRFKEEEKSLRTISKELGVSMERIAAVVRLREIRKEMEQEGKELNTPLANALTKLMPTTALPRDGKPSKHDPANSFLVPSLTGHQLFVPIPESRHLTSSEAARLIGVPAPDELIPHPELIQFEKLRNENADIGARRALAQEHERMEKERVEREEKKRKLLEERSGDVIERGRWRWRLREAKVGFVGERYGVPKEDRKKGNQKEWLECRHYAYGI